MKSDTLARMTDLRLALKMEGERFSGPGLYEIGQLYLTCDEMIKDDTHERRRAFFDALHAFTQARWNADGTGCVVLDISAILAASIGAAHALLWRDTLDQLDWELLAHAVDVEGPEFPRPFGVPVVFLAKD